MRSRDQRPEANGDGRTSETSAPNERAQPDAGLQDPAVRAFEPPPWPLGLTVSHGGKMTCSVPHDLAVILTPQAFTQLFGYAYATSLEISCLGVVRREGARFLIERFCLVKQKSSAAHTELDAEAIAAIVEELRKEGKTEELTALKCWAHSHPNLGLFWSKTDDDTCSRLVSDWLVSLVVSNDFAIRCRIDVGGAVPFTIDQVPVFIQAPVDADLLAQLRSEVQSLVSEAVLVSLPGNVSAAPVTLTSGAPATPAVEEYCVACGNWHGKGECLFDDRWPWDPWDDERCERRGRQPSRPDDEHSPFAHDLYEP